jgi:hypothetical protein
LGGRRHEGEPLLPQQPRSLHMPRVGDGLEPVKFSV